MFELPFHGDRVEARGYVRRPADSLHVVEPREMRLAPLHNKPLLRDLVTEIAPPTERLAGKRK